MNFLQKSLKLSRFFLLAGVVSMTISSCNKDVEGCMDSTASNYNADATKDDGSCIAATPPPSTTPTFGDGYGTLSAVKSVTTVQGFDIDLGIAVAAFYNGTDFTTFLEAGTVSCESTELTLNANNSYTYTPTTDPSGISFSSTPVWSVAGNGVIPQFTHTVSFGFPSVGNVTSGGTVTIANGYTVSVGSVTGADSVLFLVGDVVATEPGNSPSHIFSAADLAGLSAGSTIVQIAAYKSELGVHDGKTFYFVNETVKSKTVTIE